MLLPGLVEYASFQYSNYYLGQQKKKVLEVIDENGLDVHRHRVAGYPLDRLSGLSGLDSGLSGGLGGKITPPDVDIKYLIWRTFFMQKSNFKLSHIL